MTFGFEFLTLAVRDGARVPPESGDRQESVGVAERGGAPRLPAHRRSAPEEGTRQGLQVSRTPDKSYGAVGPESELGWLSSLVRFRALGPPFPRYLSVEEVEA